MPPCVVHVSCLSDPRDIMIAPRALHYSKHECRSRLLVGDTTNDDLQMVMAACCVYCGDDGQDSDGAQAANGVRKTWDSATSIQTLPMLRRYYYIGVESFNCPVESHSFP